MHWLNTDTFATTGVWVATFNIKIFWWNNKYSLILLQTLEVYYIISYKEYWLRNELICVLCLFVSIFKIYIITEPSPPGQPEITNYSSVDLTAVYNIPDHKNGIITHQEITFAHIPYDVCASNNVTREKSTESITIQIYKSDQNYTFTLESLKPFWEYFIKVRVNTSAGFSNFSESLIIKTRPSSK